MKRPDTIRKRELETPTTEGKKKIERSTGGVNILGWGKKGLRLVVEESSSVKLMKGLGFKAQILYQKETQEEGSQKSL